MNRLPRFLDAGVDECPLILGIRLRVSHMRTVFDQEDARFGAGTLGPGE